jgi:hypothetical protein
VRGSIDKYEATTELVQEPGGTRIIYRSVAVPGSVLASFASESTVSARRRALQPIARRNHEKRTGRAQAIAAKLAPVDRSQLGNTQRLADHERAQRARRAARVGAWIHRRGPRTRIDFIANTAPCCGKRKDRG